MKENDDGRNVQIQPSRQMLQCIDSMVEAGQESMDCGGGLFLSINESDRPSMAATGIRTKDGKMIYVSLS